MRTAGPAILGQHAQSLFGFSTCKRKDFVSELWPSFCSSDRVGLSSVAIINGRNYEEDKANTNAHYVAGELSTT